MSVLNLALQNNGYNIYIDEGSFKEIGARLAAWYQGSTIAVVTDSNVDRLYGCSLVRALESVGWRVCKLVIPAGEANKSLTTLEWLYNQLAENHLDRSDLILAFGGGVVGDIAGFAAATYLRGIAYVQLPTTLMAQLDSSIGGKTAVNLQAGKNLAGCFYQPKAVYIYTELLETLSDRVFCDGLSEAVKYAAILDIKLYKLMQEAGSVSKLRQLAYQIIVPCCSIKKELVQKDELDTSDRLLLNFGHTLGHGLEKYYDFNRFTHGEAVSIGMQHITLKSEALGLTEPGTHEGLSTLLQLCQLPIAMPELDKNKLLNIIAHDKKCHLDVLRLVLLKALGRSYIHSITKDELKRFV